MSDDYLAGLTAAKVAIAEVTCDLPFSEDKWALVNKINVRLNELIAEAKPTPLTDKGD